MGNRTFGSDRDWRTSSGPLPGLPPLRSSLPGGGALWGAADGCTYPPTRPQASRVAAANGRVAHRTPSDAVGTDGRLSRNLAAAAACRPATATTTGISHPASRSAARVCTRCRAVPRLLGPQLRSVAACGDPPIGRRHRIDLHDADRANLLRQPARPCRRNGTSRCARRDESSGVRRSFHGAQSCQRLSRHPRR